MPPKPWSTMLDGSPNAFRAKAWPSSWTRIDTSTTPTQMMMSDVLEVEREERRDDPEHRLDPDGDPGDPEVGLRSRHGADSTAVSGRSRAEVGGRRPP